jgi:Co/Zn/Cd efflux system component
MTNILVISVVGVFAIVVTTWIGYEMRQAFLGGPDERTKSVWSSAIVAVVVVATGAVYHLRREE